MCKICPTTLSGVWSKDGVLCNLVWCKDGVLCNLEFSWLNYRFICNCHRTTHVIGKHIGETYAEEIAKRPYSGHVLWQ